MRFKATVYRAHNPRWAWRPLSGEGARLYGGRFNRIGVPALYTSLSPFTALIEASQVGRSMQPTLLCAYEVDAEPIFDTADDAQRKTYAVAETDLRCPHWREEMFAGKVPASQALADRLVEAGYAGMLVRSFARGADPNTLNLVFWTWGDKLPSRAVLIDDERRLLR